MTGSFVGIAPASWIRLGGEIRSWTLDDCLKDRLSAVELEPMRESRAFVLVCIDAIEPDIATDLASVIIRSPCSCLRTRLVELTLEVRQLMPTPKLPSMRAVMSISGTSLSLYKMFKAVKFLMYSLTACDCPGDKSLSDEAGRSTASAATGPWFVVTEVSCIVVCGSGSCLSSPTGSTTKLSSVSSSVSTTKLSVVVSLLMLLPLFCGLLVAIPRRSAGSSLTSNCTTRNYVSEE